MSRGIDIGAVHVAAVRLTLELSQAAFAERLGVSRRTVIRGEQRGMEIARPWNGGPRAGMRAAWERALKQAQASPRYREVAKSDALAAVLARVSHNEATLFRAELAALPAAKAPAPKVSHKKKGGRRRGSPRRK